MALRSLPGTQPELFVCSKTPPRGRSTRIVCTPSASKREKLCCHDRTRFSALSSQIPERDACENRLRCLLRGHGRVAFIASGLGCPLAAPTRRLASGCKSCIRVFLIDVFFDHGPLTTDH